MPPRIRVTLLLLVACLLPATSAKSLDPSGMTVAVIPSADADGAAGRRVLRVMGPVFMGDRVQTGAKGEAQIEFRDSTRLVVGANSLLTIDAFVFDDSNTARKVTMNAVKGAFRFITGRSKKQAYLIRTPTTTIGIRGTRFDLAVEGNGQTTFALFDGEARLCDRQGRCRDVGGRCAVAVIPPRGGVTEVVAGPERAARLAALFPYVVSQARLHRDFRVDTSSCMTRQARLQDPRQRTIDAFAPGVTSPPEGPTPPGPNPGPGNPPTDTSRPNNPGNGKAVGNAGESPGNGNFGGGTRGRSDVAKGNAGKKNGGRKS